MQFVKFEIKGLVSGIYPGGQKCEYFFILRLPSIRLFTGSCFKDFFLGFEVPREIAKDKGFILEVQAFFDEGV